MVQEKQRGTGPNSCTEFAERICRTKLHSTNQSWNASSINLNRQSWRGSVYYWFWCLYDEQDGFITRRIGNCDGVTTAHDCDHGEWVDRHNRGGHSQRERCGHVRHGPYLNTLQLCYICAKPAKKMIRNGKIVHGKCDNFVLFVVLGVSNLTWSAEDSAENAKGLTPDDQETTKALWEMQSFENYKGSLQTWFTKPQIPRDQVRSCYHSRPQSPHWTRRIAEQWEVCNWGTRFGHSMGSKLPMQNGKSHKKRRAMHESFQISWRKTEGHTHWQVTGIWQSLWRSSMEPLYVYTSRSETNGIAERAVRRVKEGTSSVLLQSRLDEQVQNLWNVTAFHAITKISHQLENSTRTAFWRTFQWVEYHPISTKDQARFHQFGKKKLSDIFKSYAQLVVGSWKGDLLEADVGKLQENDASEVQVKRK